MRTKNRKERSAKATQVSSKQWEKNLNTEQKQLKTEMHKHNA